MTFEFISSKHPHCKITWHNPQLSQINCWFQNEQRASYRPCERMLISQNSKITPPKKTNFVVRKVDEKLIGRQPSSECSLPFLGFNQSLKSRPWYKSTSQLDTISSLVNMDLLRNKFNFMNITASNFIQASTQTTNKSKYTIIGTAISDRKRLLVWQDEQ